MDETYDDTVFDYMSLCDDLHVIESISNELDEALTSFITNCEMYISIETYGFTASSKAMYSNEMIAICPGFATESDENILEAIHISTEGIIQKIGQLIKDMMAKLADFMRKLFSTGKGLRNSLHKHTRPFRAAPDTEHALNTEVFGYDRQSFDRIIGSFEEQIKLLKFIVGEIAVEGKLTGRGRVLLDQLFVNLGFIIDTSGHLREKVTLPKRTKITIGKHGFDKNHIDVSIGGVEDLLDRNVRLEAVRKTVVNAFKQQMKWMIKGGNPNKGASSDLGFQTDVDATDKKELVLIAANLTKVFRYLTLSATRVGMQQLDMMRAYIRPMPIKKK